MNYTKGNWKAKGRHVLLEEDDSILAIISDKCFDPDANAHLIAAAPAMYEALKELVASEKHRTAFRAEQALAKAEGK